MEGRISLAVGTIVTVLHRCCPPSKHPTVLFELSDKDTFHKPDSTAQYMYCIGFNGSGGEQAFRTGLMGCILLSPRVGRMFLAIASRFFFFAARTNDITTSTNIAFLNKSKFIVSEVLDCQWLNLENSTHIVVTDFWIKADT